MKRASVHIDGSIWCIIFAYFSQLYRQKLTLSTVDTAIALEGWVTMADFLVVLCNAGCPYSTRLAQAKWNTLSPDLVTPLCLVAFIIAQASHINTGH